MNINKRFFNSIKPILIKLKKRIGNEFVIFGSAPLYLLGILKFKDLKNFNDIDIAIKDILIIPKEAETVMFQNNPNQKFYKIKIDNINIDIGPGWPGEERFFSKLFRNPINIEGFKFVNLDTTEEWKEYMYKKYNREKDKKYLEKIKKYKTKI